MPFAQLYWPARSLNNTLGNKEFDEEDFFVSGPTSLAYQSQPTSARNGRTTGTVKVALLDGFGNVMTVDTGGSSITLGIASGAGGVLTSATSLTKSLVQGTATWTDLKITGASGAYKLGADSSVSGVPDQHEPSDQPHALTAGPLDPAVPAGPSPVGTTGRSGACAQEQPPERGDQRGDDDGDEPRRSRAVRVHGDCDRSWPREPRPRRPDPGSAPGFGLKFGGRVPAGGVWVGEPAGAAVGGGTLTVIVPLRPPIVSAYENEPGLVEDMTVGLARPDRTAVETGVGVRDGVIGRAGVRPGDRLADEDGDCGRVEAGVADRDVVVCRPCRGDREQEPDPARERRARPPARGDLSAWR